MFVDSMGSSRLVILTAWREDKLTRSDVNLFPNKFNKGFSGLHFFVSAAESPPYVMRIRGVDSGEGYSMTMWEGIEVRVVKTLGMILNFTLEFIEPRDSEAEAADRVLKEMAAGKADIGIGGIYNTAVRNEKFALSVPHTLDCAAFISLASTALPKYRAIMGPFLWDVWLTLTITYILAIFPIAFSVWHSFQPLIEKPSELENMFWYVFGTFTNCFSFTGKNSWSRTKNVATRIFIGSYWAFTIMITAAYSGSLITFITIPEMPEVIDSPRQIIQENFRVSTLESGGWVNLLTWAKDPVGKEIFRRHDTVNDIMAGLHNVTKSIKSRKPTAFLGSKEHLDYVVMTNFTSSLGSKKAVFHTSRVCFSPLLVSLALPPKALYMEELNQALIKAFQGGFMAKIINEVHWKMFRSSTGKLLHAASIKSMFLLSGDRQLTLDDTSGMFMLLGIGFSFAFLSLAFEIIHWIRCDIAHRKIGQPTIKKRISDYCINNYRKFSKMVMSPSADYTADQHMLLWQYMYCHTKARLSRIGWSLFGSPVTTAKPTPYPSPHQHPRRPSPHPHFSSPLPHQPHVSVSNTLHTQT